MSTAARIALLFAPSSGYGDGVLRGIAAFARPGRPWLFHAADPGRVDLAELHAWGPDGIIALLTDARTVPDLRALGVPVVNVGFRAVAPDFDHVGNDDHAIGALAARHFLDRGFRNCAFIGWNRMAMSQRRHAGFSGAIVAAGGSCALYRGEDHVFSGMPALGWAESDGRIRRWLRGLEKPVAVLAANDGRAWQIAEQCRAAGVRVPEDVALVGVDNEQTVCRLAWPPLSSVVVAAEEVGRLAARMLDQRLVGRQRRRGPINILVSPIEVAIRRSSDVIAVDDADLATALRVIAAHADRGLGVAALARASGLPRRTLEARFRRHLGRSPLAEIQRARCAHVCQLLAQGGQTIAVVAARCGFASPRHLATVFRRVTGQSPSGYRTRVGVAVR